MAVVAIVAAVVVIVVIALVAVGREAFTLAAQPRQAVFDVDEAVDFVADRVPEEVSARISYDDVRALVRFHLDHLAATSAPAHRCARISYDDVRALVRFHLDHLAATGAPAHRWDAAANRLVVVDDEEGAEVLMARAIEHGLDLTPDDVAAVLAAELAYFEAIGAIGPPVPEPLELLAAEEEAKGALGPGDPERD